MSQSKRNNIIFYSILALVVILGILGTAFAIYKHKGNVDKNGVTNTPKEEEIKPFLTFKEVSESDTIDIFKKYPINPIEINFTKGKVKISGLKDKEIENKVNEKLSVLTVKESEFGNNCHINTNVSNVLSISCAIETVNVNLKTGEEITIEELFNKDSDIYSFIVKSSYNSTCMWGICSPEDNDSEYDNNIENTIAENLQKIKNNDYILSVNTKNVVLTYESKEDEFSGIYLEYYDFFNDITIYDRYLDNSIYEKNITDYCEPNNCADKIYELLEKDNNGYADAGHFINDKTYVNFRINNQNNIDPDYNYISKEITELNLKDYINLLEKEILKKEKLDTEGNNYAYIYINADIYYHTANDYQVYYRINKKEYKKEDFIKYHLGFNEAKEINTKTINAVNMLIDKNKKISYLSDNPTKDIPNFETKLYEYIMQELKKAGNDFAGYDTCYFSEDENCEEKRDYHNLIKEASFAIDKVNNKLHMYEEKPGMYEPISFVSARISLDVFNDTPLNVIKKINEEEALSLFDKKGLHILYFDSVPCEPCRNLEVELDSLVKTMNINIYNTSLNSSNTFDKLYSKLDIKIIYEEKEATYGELLKNSKLSPTVVVIKDGKMVDGFIGFKEAEDITKIVEKYK